MCCVEDNIYLVGGEDPRRVTKYNPRTNTLTDMPRLQKEIFCPNVCTLDNKIFVLGRGINTDTTCEVLDLSEDDPQWRYTADMNSRHSGTAVVIERKIYFLAYDKSVHVYDVDQGIYIV